MRYKLIGCKLLQREVADIISKSKNIIDLTLMKQDYHQTPEILKNVLQQEIDSIDDNTNKYTNDLRLNDIDAILLGYGLCSNAIVGLKSKKYKIVIPRAHDCATLLMGSKEKYKAYFESSGGSYFYSQGWLELGINEDEQHLEKLRKEYMEKYEDEDTVDYLMSVEEEMLKNYDCATLVSWPGFTADFCEKEVREIAEKKQWKFQHIVGSPSLLEDLINGNWNDERFLVLEPGQEMAPSYDDMVMHVKEEKTK